MTQSTFEERRLVAIMFTDMVGYSALTQQNEALALKLLEEHRTILRPIFKKHTGNEIETIGDAFFVEFASALEAVKCAIEIQNKLFERNQPLSGDKRITLRIGIHLGDVVHKGENVLGDGVNIAARIEPLARPGGIAVSEDVFRQIRNKIQFPLENLGRRELKNIEQPIEVYSVTLPWLEKKHKGTRIKSTPVTRTMKIFRPFRIAIAICIIAFIFFYFWQSFDAHVVDRSTIAVLPFQNMSGQIENEYFSDGITEDIITHLSKLNNLKVISRTSVMQYKNSEKSIKQIGKELNVSTILEGSVRRSDNRVRVVAQLIDALTDQHIWSATYDTILTEIFTIQTDVANNIGQALKTKISINEEKQISKQSTEIVEAYDLYLKGRYYWNKMLPDELQLSINYFEQAISQDPNYALAYAGLADAYCVLGNFNVLPPKETYQNAKATASKALRIDPELAEAHASLGYAITFSDWDWAGAEKEFKKAISLNSGYMLAYNWYALFLTAMGSFEEASFLRKKCLELDPLSPVVYADYGLELYFEKKYDLAIEQNLKALELDPLFHAAYITLGGAYIKQTRYAEAIATFSKASMFSKGHAVPTAALGYAYAASGRSEDALMVLELLQEQSKEKYVSPYWNAVIYTALNDREKAIKWLQSAYEEKDGSMVFLKVMPVFENLHNDPRFTKLVNKMGL